MDDPPLPPGSPHWANSWQIAAWLHRLELVAVTLWDLKDLELSKATVGRPRTMLEGLVSDRSRSAMQDLRCRERVSTL